MWSASKGLIRPWDEFDLPWRDQGGFAGGEHDVYFRDDRVWKRHVAEEALDFGTYFSYLTRIALHALIFPETPYRLEGFTESPDGVLMTLLSQPEVRYDPERWMEPAEVDWLMARRGFRKAGATCYISEDGILEVSDMHTENVVLYHTGTDERVLAVVDADINLIPPGWSSTHA